MIAANATGTPLLLASCLKPSRSFSGTLRRLPRYWPWSLRERTTLAVFVNDRPSLRMILLPTAYLVPLGGAVFAVGFGAGVAFRR